VRTAGGGPAPGADAPLFPAPLARVIAEFQVIGRAERMEQLIEYADRFVEVPRSVAARPFAEESRAPHCESEAFVFPVDQPDGTLRFHFAVDNPQGLSARAWAVILDETCSGQSLEQVARVPQEAIFRIFGRDLSMGKGMGLTGMLALVTRAARVRLLVHRGG
jgi:cysteine desulfuration protein SufE